MNLYLLTAIDSLPSDRNPWAIPYDCAHGFVVRAADAKRARQIATYGVEDAQGRRQTPGGDELHSFGGMAWLDANYSDCAILAENVAGDEGIVLRDFRAG